MRGNYIHDSSTGIVAYDGLDGRDDRGQRDRPPGRPWGIELYSDRGSIVRHNTLVPGDCAFKLPCGIIDLGGRDGAPSTGTVVTGNVAADIAIERGSSVAERRGNLLGNAAALDGDIAGAPRFAGGATPDRWAGFRLAASSPGEGAGVRER